MIDKSSWGEGPWQHEPDGGAWITHADLLGCFIRHPRRGHLNGYVALPPDHPLTGKDVFHHAFEDIDVHGGVTFAGHINSDDVFVRKVLVDVDERLYWLGFDCHHFRDFAPGFAAEMNSLPPELKPLEDPRNYRPVAYVKREVESLARQLVQIHTGAKSRGAGWR